jgi:hypothetical protein
MIPARFAGDRMRRFVEGTDRGQSTLFPECLGDWIGEDNPVRVIDVFVDELDLAELGFDGVEPEVTGRPSYHPSVLLKCYPSNNIPEMTSITSKYMRVLISGAGIAGLTVAYWLQRYGFLPTIVERAPSLLTGGYNIDVRGTALQVLRRTGIHDAVGQAPICKVRCSSIGTAKSSMK